MSAPRNKLAELREALGAKPDPSKGDRAALCERLDVDPYELSRMISRVKHDPRAGTGSGRSERKTVALPIVDVGEAMAPGDGERRDTCVNYSACLGVIVRRTNGPVHCPLRCTRFAEMDRAAELQARVRSGRAAA